jgi:adenylate kinase family enzyme
LLPSPNHLDRVVVVGTSGAGKSTTGAKLAAGLGHPFVELDELFWGPNWQPKREEQFVSLVRAAAAGERWVVAGNYGVARPEIWPRASAIIWLNFSLPLVLCRLLPRTAKRLLRREVLWHGNRESVLRTLFTRESIVWWAITTHNRRKEQFAALRAANQYPHLRWYEFTRPSEVERFLAAGD